MKVWVVLSRNCRTGETTVDGVYSTESRANKECAKVNNDTNRYNDEYEGEVVEEEVDE